MEKQTVLVVDDQPDNIDVLASALRPEYRVKAALNGEKALRISAGAQPPDLILLDIMMADMDGHEVLNRLKANPATMDIPVMFVTARNLDSDEQEALGLGAVDYITKPINPAIVRARVNNYLALLNQNRELNRKLEEGTVQLDEKQRQLFTVCKPQEPDDHCVFVSHASANRELVEQTVISALQDAGIRTWYSRVSIQSAAEWERSILKGLKQCDWFLIVMSTEALQSEWVKDELVWAIDNRPGKLIPVMLNPCDESDFHIRMRRLQVIDLTQDVESGQDQIVSTILAP